MQKKIIVLAIASALTAPALALADSANVTIYGQANLSYDIVRTGTTALAYGPGTPPAVAAGTGGASSNRVSSNSSRIGVKGSEDLGGGTSVIWQIESGVNMDGFGTSTLGTRDTYAGLSGASWGTVLLGRHDTPYKMSTRGLDQFADGIADNRSLMGGGDNGAGFTQSAAQFDLRSPDVLAYISPNLSGFSIAAAYINLAETNTLSTDAKNTGTSLAGMYDMAPFYAAVAYQNHNFGSFGTVPSTSEKAYKLGLGYTMNAFNVDFVYEKTKDDFATGATDTNFFGHNAYYLAGKFNISDSDAVKAAYTKAGSSGGANLLGVNDGAKQYSLGYDHNLSKRTTVYVLYTKLKNDTAAGYGLSAAATSGGATSVNGFGGSPAAFSLGMKHWF